jgi:hypothetical protein
VTNKEGYEPIFFTPFPTHRIQGEGRKQKVMTADLLLMGGVHTHTQHALERKRVLRHRKNGVQGINILRLDHIDGLKAGGDRSGP